MSAASVNHQVTEPELAVLGRWLARAYLEIERGQRSPWTLEHLVSPLLLRVLLRTPGHRHGRPVAACEVGGVVVSLRASCGYVTVGVAAPQGRWDALLVELRRLDGRWTVVDLGRLGGRLESRTGRPRADREAVAS